MRWPRDPHLRNAAWLRAQYVHAGRSQKSIARQLYVSRSELRKALARFGIERTLQLDFDEVRQLYVDEGLSLTEVGRRVGASETAVRCFLRDHGVERRAPWRGKPAGPLALTDAELVHRYVELGQSGTKIAAELGVDANRVYRRLTALGIQRRRPVQLDLDQMRARYVEDGATLDELAAEYGCAPETVRHALQRAGIARRGGAPRRPAATRARLQTDWLRVRYVDDQATLDEIAAEIGCGAETVRLALERAGVPRRAGSSGRASPVHARLDARWLRARYVADGATLDEMAAEVGCSSETVRRALKDAGIARPIGAPRRRRQVDAQR